MSDAKTPTTLEAAIIKALNEDGWTLLSWSVSTNGGYDVETPERRLNLNITAAEKVR